MDETTKIIIAGVSALGSFGVSFGISKFIVVGFFKDQKEATKRNSDDIQELKEGHVELRTILRERGHDENT